MKHKHRDSQEIIKEINALLHELAQPRPFPKGTLQRIVSGVDQKKAYSGPSGGIKLLVEEGFFAGPKTQPEVADRLRQEGYNYIPQAISVALLRNVRARTLVRLPSTAGGKEKWSYARRK